MYFVACSGGNDSVALIQFMLEQGEPLHVVYNNTKWAHKSWALRMSLIEQWVRDNGHEYTETHSEGMEKMVRRKGGWPKPSSDMQFCTGILKEQPSAMLYDLLDPEKNWIVCTGRRREESRNRADLPDYLADSEKHGGRDVWNPLYKHTAQQRDELIKRTPFTVLPHSSLECYPCINANKGSGLLANLEEDRIQHIENFELSLGRNGKGNPRTMFRPKRCGGAVGIRQVIEWAKGKRGWKAASVPEAYVNLPIIMGGEEIDEASDFGDACDSGYCGN